MHENIQSAKINVPTPSIVRKGEETRHGETVRNTDTKLLEISMKEETVSKALIEREITLDNGFILIHLNSIIIVISITMTLLVALALLIL